MRYMGTLLKFPLDKSSLKSLPGNAAQVWQFWKNFQSLNIKAIVEEAKRPTPLALVGSEGNTDRLKERLGRETPSPRSTAPLAEFVFSITIGAYSNAQSAPTGSIILDADLLIEDESELAKALANIVITHPTLRLALARHIPAFRPAVAVELIAEASKENARIALISALPGVLPLTGFLSPATALGDMIILTKNQVVLLLKIAAAYGKEIELKARLRELLPVVGSAFGWRAAARELVGLVPGGIGLVVKGSIAYAGTYTIGKAAVIYYSTGQKLTGPRLGQLYRDSLKEAAARIRPLLKRLKNSEDTKTTVDILPEERV